MVGWALSACVSVGLATVLGAVPVLFVKQIDQRTTTSLLGFGGGVMLSATAFSLIIPGIEAAIAAGFGKWGLALVMALGIGLGSMLLAVVHQLFPHEHIFKLILATALG